MEAERALRIAAVVLLKGGALLLVRKSTTSIFILPGGKFEASEDAVACVLRELAEETGVRLDRKQLRHFGEFVCPSALEPWVPIHATVFIAGCVGEPRPRAEIAEVLWHRIEHDGDYLAPLIRDHVLPRLRTKDSERKSP